MNDGPRNTRPRRGRHYVWPPGPPHELEVPSVTTILGEGVPKPFLKPWGEKMVAEYAVKHLDAWSRLPERDAIDLLKRAPFRFTERKAELGTAVHAALEKYVNDIDPPTLTREERGYYEGGLAYLTEQRPTVLHSEATVYSRTHGYAGTFDILQQRGLAPFAPTGRMAQDFPDQFPVEIADFKTSKRVYPEVALQLVSYARADFIASVDGVTEIPLPTIRRGVIVRLSPSGGYEAVPVPLDDEVWATFLAARALFGWSRDISRRVLGEPLPRLKAAA